jgi:putative PIN family toxin of toxin-antitoxin system
VRFVLDSSVLVAAFISRAGVCANVMEDVLAHHELALSNYILDELTRKLAGKFGFRPADVREVRRFLAGAAVIVEAAALPSDSCRDPRDVPVLGTAIAAGADALVTVDKDMLVLRTFQGVRIARPGEFWRIAESGGPARSPEARG